MRLFRRRGRQGEDAVELTGTQADQLASDAFGVSLKRYSEPLSADLDRLFHIYPEFLVGDDNLERLAGDGWSAVEVGSVMMSVARCGYVYRQWEEEVFSEYGPVRVLALGLQQWRAHHPDVAVQALILQVCSNLARPAGGVDPWTGTSGVPQASTGGLRRLVAERSIAAVLGSVGEEKANRYPAAVEYDHLESCWRFGLFARCAEVSLPAGETLAPAITPEEGHLPPMAARG